VEEWLRQRQTERHLKNQAKDDHDTEVRKMTKEKNDYEAEVRKTEPLKRKRANEMSQLQEQLKGALEPCTRIEIKQQIAQLKEQIAPLQGQIKQLRGQIKQLKDQIKGVKKARKEGP
jgi:flagellar biosynthesis chaperone FliJ